MKDIETGIKLTLSQKTEESLLASMMGSGSLDVLATPAVVALMENAAASLVAPYLDEGITTVGTMISIKHISATPKGAEFSATAELTAIDGRKYTFAVTARDDAGIIAEGTHERFSVKSESFMQKTNTKFSK